MLGLFYAYTEEYKTSKCLWPIYTDVCCEMDAFFRRLHKALNLKIKNVSYK